MCLIIVDMVMQAKKNIFFRVNKDLMIKNKNILCI